MTDFEILASGPELIQKGIRGVEPVTQELLIQANSEIQIMVYMFSSGALHILDLVEKAAERGVKVTVIVNNLQSQSPEIIRKLREIARKLPHARICDFKDPEGRQLHAKVLITDRKRAIVGSANFSWGGMFSNYEVGLLIEGPAVWKLAEIIDFMGTKSVSIQG